MSCLVFRSSSVQCRSIELGISTKIEHVTLFMYKEICLIKNGDNTNGDLVPAVISGVDSSAPALELAKANASLNQIDANLIDFVKADVGEYMKSALSQGLKWDIVILDPPKLAPNRKVHIFSWALAS